MDFPLDSISYVRDVKNYNFDGIADLQVKAKDVFKFQGLSTLLRIDSLSLNGDHYGTLRLDASAPNIEETVYASLSIFHDTMELTLDGYFNPPSLKGIGKERRMRDQPLFFDFDLGISKYPVRIINYFVAEVENVKGYVSADRVRFYGTPSKPELDGYVAVHGAQFTLKPLRTTYRVPEGRVKVSSRLFDGTGNYAYDRFNNRAYLEGGITHDHLKNFGLDLRITTDSGKGFLGLETTAKDNPVFYGTAVGTGYVRFSGNFQKTNLYVNARTLRPTHITIPMTSSVTTKNTRFIVFTEDLPPKGSDNSRTSSEPRGLNMEFDLDITPDAMMEVIFDKAWGDVLKGTGSGFLNVNITREGDFKMNGDYTVATGDYLF
jgi:autotransporter translocation and assembly factor TamB